METCWSEILQTVAQTQRLGTLRFEDVLRVERDRKLR